MLSLKWKIDKENDLKIQNKKESFEAILIIIVSN